ncbi:hypothetical protein HYY69_01025 [Candidatus Woesearchaeota archaeon]|nr:hypothetical protein [Candidatus Woesearchaeota archaeon]
MEKLKKLTIGSGKHSLYNYEINGKILLFKELTKEEIGNEVLVRDLAKMMSIDFFDVFESPIIDQKQGILMDYYNLSKTLYNISDLHEKQIKKLKRIIILDLIIGNKDRHSANIIVYQDKLIPIDHTKLFSEDKISSGFIKLDVGRKLDHLYIEKIESMLQNTIRISVKNALQTYFNFSDEDFNTISLINTSTLKEIIFTNDFIENKKFVYEYISGRIKNITELDFV